MTDRFLLKVWREVALQQRLDFSLPKINEHLAEVCKAVVVSVLHVDLATNTLQTVGYTPRKSPPGHPPTRDTTNLHALNTWLLSEEVITADNSRNLPPHLEQIFPKEFTGHLLAAPIKTAGRPVGFFIAKLHRKSLSPKELAFILCLSEPLASAVINHQQLQELSNTREKVEADNRLLLSRLDRQDITESIVGAEAGLKAVCERIDLVGNADVPVLLLGETGSGKEVVARAIHVRSRRANGPFIRVNCGAIPPELIDSHLFGHERGSFSGAENQHKGWFERADGGTLFLDEIGDLPLPAQVRLLRVLQDGTFERVGGQRTLTVNVRLVAATHRNLRGLVTTKTFREDLWYRIATFPIQIPPLRDRVQDIPILAAHFALRSAKRLGVPPLALTSEDNELLINYDWPGNVRELAAVIERAVILGNGRSLEVGKALGLGLQMETKKPVQASRGEEDAISSLENAIARHIERALTITEGQVEGRRGAASLLGVNPNTLRAKIRKLNINCRRFRED